MQREAIDRRKAGALDHDAGVVRAVAARSHGVSHRELRAADADRGDRADLYQPLSADGAWPRHAGYDAAGLRVRSGVRADAWNPGRVVSLGLRLALSDPDRL